GVADYHHNVWAGSQSDVASDYQGTGDKYGDPLLNRTSGWASFTSYDQPDVSDFHLQLGSPAIDVADDNWPFDEFQRDWYGNTRPVVTPDMGAIEFGSDEGGGGQFDTVPLRINCGGDTTTFTDGTGADWEQDRGYNAGTEPAQVTDAIAGTTDDELYQWTRLVGPGSQNTQALPLRYSFDIPNGIYTVRLHYNETYWEETNRFFNVFINDVQVENELCIWLEAGGKNTALARTHENVE
ncbi:MAG: hypothetical protein GWN58_57050, partial [Anaerolineae bacterium]|nr:hypothetical protein [Anaerolineae bacterium]